MICELANAGILNSKKPNKFNENINRTIAIKIRKSGCWNCIPHPIFTPNDRIKIRIRAKVANDEIIPKEVIKKLFPTFNLLLEDFRTDKIFIDKTGNTHGIKFKIIPPKILITKM